MRPLLPYQFAAMEYMRTHPHAMCFMDKRLGKTTCAYRWGQHHIPPGGKCLVVSPLSAIPGWQDELESDGEELVWDLSNDHNMREWAIAGGNLPGRYFMVNSQGLFKAGRGSEPSPWPVAIYPWSAVIWDEITTINNPQSQINKVAHACFSDVPLRCGLSGEYVPESPLNVFEPAKWIFGSFMGFQNFWKWRFEYFNELGYEWLPKHGAKKEIKHVVMERGFVLSREDAGIGEVSSREKRWCELPARLRKVYDHAEKYFEIPDNAVCDPDDAAVASDGVPRMAKFTNYSFVVRQWTRQLAGGYPKHFPDLHSRHKLDLLWEMAGKTYSNYPLVVSFAYTAELHTAHEMFVKHKVPCAAIWGDVKAQDRRVRTQLFREGKIRIMLKQAAVHFGMDLSAADTMIRFSFPERYQDISQDKDRIVHPTKKRPLLYCDLGCKSTIDEDLIYAASEKTLNARYFMTRMADSVKKRLGQGVKL